MATFKICVFEHHRRQDGKYRVSIRLTHHRERAYIKTDVYVVRKQINSNFTDLRDTELIRTIDKDIFKYEDILLKGLGSNLERYTAKELASYIEKHTATDEGAGIDFVAFSNAHINKLKSQGRKGYADNFNIAVRALTDYFGRETIYIKEITSKNLKGFAEYLQSSRTMVRTNQFGKTYSITRPPVKDQTVADYLRSLQILFNAARDEYNDEDEEIAVITHNPFRKSLVTVREEPAKRNLPIEELRRIIGSPDYAGRMGLARDVFLLSFYFIGMNTADLYAAEASALSDGRLTYERQKTASRRKDKALISLRVEPEAEDFIQKYRDPAGKRAFSFYRMYSDSHIFNSNLNKGLKQIARELDITPSLSTYYARHTWATIAANDCGYSDSDIAVALNHSAGELKVTRGYIARSWDKVDAMNRAVLDFVLQKQ